jgi:hypothetical protein
LRSASLPHREGESCGGLGRIGDICEGRVVLDHDNTRRGAGEHLPEVIGADIEGIEVLVALELDSERLFDDAGPD